jgi:uncharacterized protein YerC
MPRVSKYVLDKKVVNQLYDSLDLVISKLDKKEVTGAFLQSFLTPTERIMLAKRLAVIILLKEKVPQSQIATTLNMSRITVSRMELFLEARGEGLNVILDILKKEQLIKDVKHALLQLAKYTTRAAGGRVKPTIF